MVTIRKALVDDSERLTEMSRQAKAGLGYPSDWLKAWESQLLFTPQYIRSEVVFVAEKAGKVVGVIALVELPDPEIDHLWVDPAVQSQGIGSRLLDEAYAACNERGWNSLRVVADPFAVPFYEKKGFRVIGLQDAPVLGHPRQLPILERAV
jgi:GNAT superfamily N-acetyltransferase